MFPLIELGSDLLARDIARADFKDGGFDAIENCFVVFAASLHGAEIIHPFSTGWKQTVIATSLGLRAKPFRAERMKVVILVVQSPIWGFTFMKKTLLSLIAAVTVLSITSRAADQLVQDASVPVINSDAG